MHPSFRGGVAGPLVSRGRGTENAREGGVVVMGGVMECRVRGTDDVRFG